MRALSPALPYFHVDVFSTVPFNGNSLAVFPDAGVLDAKQMLAITQEMRHFETVFLFPDAERNTYHARVFDLFEELDFAGHPLIGAGAVLHALQNEQQESSWQFILPKKRVQLTSYSTEAGVSCVLNQGAAEFIGEVVDEAMQEQLLNSLSLKRTDLAVELPLEVVSTGLAYLIVPVHGALSHAQIVNADFESLLARIGAQFAYILDVDALEGRHWNNDGIMEDVATGSAAGTVGAYLAKHGRVPLNQSFQLRQGRFVGRPSEIVVRPLGEQEQVESVEIGGDVALVAEACLMNLPTVALSDDLAAGGVL